MVTESVLNDFLEHYGKRGMKWGVRSASGGASSGSSSSKSSSKKTVHPPSEDSSSANTLRKKPLHSLTNQELKTVTERQRLEQSYKQMNPTKMSSGKKKAAEILATAGILVTAYNVAHSPAMKAITNAGKTFLEKKQLLRVTKLLSNSGPG